MLKRFFITVLGAVTGVWIAIAIGIFCLLGIVGAALSSTTVETPKVQKHSALYLNLQGQIPDRYQPGDFWQMIRDSEEQGDALVDIIRSIDNAAGDSKIEGIYINAPVGATAGGVSALEEIVEALQRFKASGKWIMAYGDVYTQGAYMLASQADSVCLNPMGSVDIHGVAAQTPYFKDMLDKLGIRMQIVRVGTFKSAVEPFMLQNMSPAAELQTRVMLDSIWSCVAGTMADARGISTAKVNLWADSLMSTWSAADIQRAGAVNSLAYRRQFEKTLRRNCGLKDDDDLRLITPSEYIATLKNHSKSDRHIAVYFASGDIVDTGEGGIVGDKVVPDILRLADDENVAGMVLRVNSGGGSAYASEQIWEALQYFKSKGKPLYVSMGDYSASGGYYISCGADRIYADRTTLTGSIGVFGMIPDFSGLTSGKLGINFCTVATNPEGTIASPFGQMTPGQAAALQRSVDDIYDIFTRRVAEGRGMPQDSVKLIAEGRVWPGGSALRLGLVDSIGSLQTTIDALADNLDLRPEQVCLYPEVKDDFLVELVRRSRSEIKLGGVTLDPASLRMMQTVEYLRRMAPVQARMAPVEIR